VRLQILGLLLDGEWDVTSLTAAIGLSQSALSQHLKKLRDAKLVHTRRDAQVICYTCKSVAVAKMYAALADFYGKQHIVQVVA
jgi:DNA-binding transcriptional ArsR family regulator